MSNNNVFRQISEWLQNYTLLGSWMYFNSTPIELGTTSLNTVSGSRELKKFIDGSKDIELTFLISMVKQYDTGTSDLNLEALDEVTNFSNWIEEQNENQEYPDLGQFKTVKSISVLSNVPSLQIDQASQLAKYTFQVRILYKDESEVIYHA